MTTKYVYLFVLGLFIRMSVACTPTSTQEPVAQISTIAVTEAPITTPPSAELLAYTWQLTAAGDEASDMFLTNS